MSRQQLDEEAIFDVARRITNAVAQSDYLDQVCAGDQALRERVEALLAVHEREREFLKSNPEPAQTVDSPAAAEAIGQQIGRYKLLQQIGEGGFGIVYMAEQHRPVRRKVALKVIKPGMDTAAVVARFDAERQALAMMDHPNISRVLDGGATESGRPYFVMELVKGVPITDYCDKNQLSTRDRLELLVTVCQAVQHAHQKGVIHRDIKPSNILVTLHDGQPVVKVIDFGVAKAINQQLTERTLFTAYGQMIGTPQYMSPEQAEMSGLDVDTRSDVYSLGVVLYELLTGATPLDAERLRTAGYAEMQRIIQEEEPPKPSTRVSSAGEQLTIVAKHRSESPERLQKLLRGELDWIVMKTLDKDRARRYESATALAADIGHFLADEPVLACPPSAAYRFRKFVNRNKAPMATAGLVLSALLIGLFATTWQAVVAKQNEQLARLRSSQAEAAKQQADQRRVEAESARREEARVRRTLERRVYGSTMQMVQNAWQSSAFISNALLDSLRPEVTLGDDLRSFEWHFWYRRLRSPAHVLRGHTGVVHDVAYSPDGRHLATAGYDRSVRIWQADSGTEIVTLEGHSDNVNSVAFSPHGDWLASAGYDSVVRIWDWAQQRELRALTGHRAPIHSVVFSHDGQTLASAGYDRKLRLWDAESGQQLQVFEGPGGDVWGVAFSPDDRLVASGHEGSIVKLWNVAGGEPAMLPGHTDGVTCVAFNSDGTRLASASHDGTARIWDVESGDQSLILNGHGSWVQSVCWSSDDQLVLTASWDGTCRVWKADDGQELFSLRGHEAYVQSAEFSPDSESIASVGNDGTLRIWKALSTDVDSVVYIDRTRAGGTSYPAFSPDSRLLFGPSTSVLNAWDTATGQLAWNAPGGLGAAVSRDGRVASGDREGNVHIYETQSGRELFTFSAEPGGFHCLAFSPDGRLLATNGNRWWQKHQPKSPKVWNAATGELVADLNDQTAWVSMTAFSPDGDWMATSSYDHTVKIWNTASWQLEQILAGHTEPVDAVAFSPSGNQIVSGAFDATVRIWDWRAGRSLHELRGHVANVVRVAYSPDGQRVVSGSVDGEVKLWDVAIGMELLSLSEHTWVEGVAFSPDGHRLATTGQDGIRIWNATPRNSDLD